MIVFNNISLKRGQTELLENATATINPKQKVGLVGKNGCGKSSLFALLKKELTPEQARILELEKQLRYAQIENAYLKELRRLRIEDARKMKEQQELLAVSEENSN